MQKSSGTCCHFNSCVFHNCQSYDLFLTINAENVPAEFGHQILLHCNPLFFGNGRQSSGYYSMCLLWYIYPRRQEKVRSTDSALCFCLEQSKDHVMVNPCVTRKYYKMNKRIITAYHLVPTFPRRYSLINLLFCNNVIGLASVVISFIVSILNVCLLGSIRLQTDLLSNVIFYPVLEQIRDYCIRELVLCNLLALIDVMGEIWSFKWNRCKWTALKEHELICWSFWCFGVEVSTCLDAPVIFLGTYLSLK